jgi:predicted O-linked N-acetylglucosamine transferase (SPINDLY family)
MSDLLMDQAIRRDGIDVLVNIRHGRPGVFSRHPAPRQFSYIGHSHWTGIEGVELIEGPLAFEPGEPLPTYMPRTGPVVFGSINRACKITGEVAMAWGRILTAVPDSKLQVAAHGGEMNGPVRRMLESAGVPGDRLRLMPKVSEEEYYRRLDGIDVLLDVWPFNGVTTTCDALCAGIPVVTMRGDAYRSRLGAMLIGRQGYHPDMVAETIEDYFHVAVTLAATIKGARGERNRFAAEARQRLGDGAAVAKVLEQHWRDHTANTSSLPR